MNMGNASEHSQEKDDAVTVSLSANGQATIPKRFRDKLGIDTPGRISFRETESGEIVVERVPGAAEMHGFAAETAEATTDKTASELLQEKRNAEKAERD